MSRTEGQNIQLGELRHVSCSSRLCGGDINKRSGRARLYPIHNLHPGTVGGLLGKKNNKIPKKNKTYSSPQITQQLEVEGIEEDGCQRHSGHWVFVLQVSSIPNITELAFPATPQSPSGSPLRVHWQSLALYFCVQVLCKARRAHLDEVRLSDSGVKWPGGRNVILNSEALHCSASLPF